MHELEHTFQVPKYLLRMLDDYLRNRTVLYQITDGKKRIKVTAGAAQRSILGPDLWNTAYDSLLRTKMPEDTLLVGYADDIAVRNVELAQLKLNQVVRTVNGWMADHGLLLALEKTEIVILIKRRINTILPSLVRDVTVETKLVIKYLGLTIDRRLSFWTQIQQTADKAAKGVSSLSRLMVNVTGPKFSKRRLLMTAVQSVLLYGAEVWADFLSK